MADAILKQNSEILVEICKAYKDLVDKKTSVKDTKKMEELDLEINKLRGQILYLLAAIKKSS